MDLSRPFSSPAGRPRGEHAEAGPAIAIFGAGAIGSWVGGRLAAGGAKVTLIGRARVLDEFRDGLTVSDLDGDRFTVKVRTSTDPSVARDAEIVLVTVKSAQTAEAGATLAKIVGGDAQVVSFQNGVRNVEVLANALGRGVIAGMVPWNVIRRSPGAYHRGVSGQLLLEHAVRAQPLYRALAAAGLAFATRTDMPAVQWGKLLLNLNNAVNALSGLPLATELSQRAYRTVLAAAQREALSLLAANQLPIARLTPVPPSFLPRMLELPDAVFRVLARPMISIDPHARSSMWDDLEARRATEIEYLQGEIVALADEAAKTAASNAPDRAPVNRALVRLVRAAETGGRRTYSGSELRASVGLR